MAEVCLQCHLPENTERLTSLLEMAQTLFFACIIVSVFFFINLFQNFRLDCSFFLFWKWFHMHFSPFRIKLLPAAKMILMFFSVSLLTEV